MEFVVSTYLSEPEHVRERLGTLVLGENSGMDNYINNVERGQWLDMPIVMAKKNDLIVAWAVVSEVPRFWANIHDAPGRREVQLFVDHNYRRQGIGRQLVATVKALYHDFSVCPWDDVSVRFFQSIRGSEAKG